MTRAEHLPPCHRDPAFTKPIPGTPATERALRICESCPIRIQCAIDALTAGDSTDGHVQRPAADVIQAGIHCTGDQMTAWRLSRIAGVEMPKVTDTTPRNCPPPYCRSCGDVMVSWTRAEVPRGRVMHYGRGFCVNCRSAYREELAAEAQDTPTHYDGGRTRSRFDRPHAPLRPLHPEPEQLDLFAS